VNEANYGVKWRFGWDQDWDASRFLVGFAYERSGRWRVLELHLGPWTYLIERRNAG